MLSPGLAGACFLLAAEKNVVAVELGVVAPVRKKLVGVQVERRLARAAALGLLSSLVLRSGPCELC